MSPTQRLFAMRRQAGRPRRHAAAAMLAVLALTGCAMHEVYEKPGLDPRQADLDWAACQARALATAGQPADPAALQGRTSASGSRLVAEVAPPRRQDNGPMVSPADYRTITTHEAALQACMREHGYRFIGVPAVERL